MVLLDVQVVEVPRSQLRELGVKWNPHTEGGMTAGLAWDAGSGRFDNRPGQAPLSIPYPTRPAAGSFGVNALLSARIDSLVPKGTAVRITPPSFRPRSAATPTSLAGAEVP